MSGRVPVLPPVLGSASPDPAAAHEADGGQVFPVPQGLIGLRLDVAASKMLGVSRSKAGQGVLDGTITLLSRPAQRSTRLEDGDILRLRLPDHTATAAPRVEQLDVLYEDEDIVVVNKPVGVAAHPSAGWTGPTVLDGLRQRGIRVSRLGAPGREGIVSRLDVGTSGVMLVCKSDLAYVEMRRQFSEHAVSKIYEAVCQGRLRQDKATIEAPIARDRGAASFRFTVSPIGKEAITHFDVIERFRLATHVRVNLETGRTHQIRVHFASIGHPLVGDPLYGADPALSARLGLERQWLQAMSLTFKHPRTHVWTTVTSRYAPDLDSALRILRDDRPAISSTAAA